MYLCSLVVSTKSLQCYRTFQWEVVCSTTLQFEHLGFVQKPNYPCYSYAVIRLKVDFFGSAISESAQILPVFMTFTFFRVFPEHIPTKSFKILTLIYTQCYIS